MTANPLLSRAMSNALLLGTIAQLAMVLAGHLHPSIAAWFAVGGMLISMAAGGLYGTWTGQARRTAAYGGALAGGGCALIGIAVSVALGDVTLGVLLYGTASSAITGALGGVAGALVGSRARAAV
jgi:hypothetical protein